MVLNVTRLLRRCLSFDSSKVILLLGPYFGTGDNCYLPCLSTYNCLQWAVI